MFYVIATVLVIIGIFFVYSAVSAFNEIRKGIEKEVPAKPYMVVLFSFVAVIFFLLAIFSVMYQSTWDQNWDLFWSDAPPLFSDETKLKIYEISNTVEPISLYSTFGFGVLFTISLVTFKKLSPHLLIVTLTLAVITFLSFIVIQYTEPEKNSIEVKQTKVVEETKVDLKKEANKIEFDPLKRDSIVRYLKNQSTDVLMLSQFLRDHFKITRHLPEANIDQLKQYVRGLTEIKQKLDHMEVPRGAEEAEIIIKLWLQQEIRIVTDCMAEKRETGLFGMMIRFDNFVSDVIFDRTKEHHNTTDKVRKMRAEFIMNQEEVDEEYFSFIQKR